MGGPSLDDVTAIKCPPHKPFKCLKYGICYGHDEYCDQSSNDVHSCFPLHLQDEGDRLGWCHRFLRGEVSALHPSCQFACNYRFNSTFGNYISPEESIGSSVAWDPYIIVWTVLAISIITNLILLSDKFWPRKKTAWAGCITPLWKKVHTLEKPPSPEDDDDTDSIDRRGRKLDPDQAACTSGKTSTMQLVGGNLEGNTTNPDAKQPLLSDQDQNPTSTVTLRHSNSHLADGHSQWSNQVNDRSSTTSSPRGSRPNSNHNPSSSNSGNPQAEQGDRRQGSGPPGPGTGSTGEASGENPAEGETYASDFHPRNRDSPQSPDDSFLRRIHVGQTQPDAEGSHKVVASGAPYQHTLD